MERKVRDNVVFVLAFLTIVTGFKRSEVTFYYFAQETLNFVEIRANNVSDVITSDTKVTFIVHGWTENRTTPWYEPLTRALQSRGYGVIQVDYSKPGSQLYPLAVLDVPKIADVISGVMVAVTRTVSLNNIHIIGHSLGGQVASHVGGCFQRQTGRKLPIIKALDPAGPFFETLGISGRRLGPDDAQIVFVIHTDMYRFGHSGVKGQIDVFINGGKALQPGCPRPDDDSVFCSHHMSYWYYIFAVQHPKGLFAQKCSSYDAYKVKKCNGSRIIDIGSDNFFPEDKGKYYLRTRARAPYRLDP